MKLFAALILALSHLALSSPVLSNPTALEPISEVQKRATIPSVSGLKFNIDGTTGYFAGSNSYWIAFLTNNADVDLVMTHLKSSGLKVLRVWGMLLLNPFCAF
jgi:mannan endo-1,4-beta-mannosidase